MVLRGIALKIKSYEPKTGKSSWDYIYYNTQWDRGFPHPLIANSTIIELLIEKEVLGK